MFEVHNTDNNYNNNNYNNYNNNCKVMNIITAFLTVHFRKKHSEIIIKTGPQLPKSSRKDCVYDPECRRQER